MIESDIHKVYHRVFRVNSKGILEFSGDGWTYYWEPVRAHMTVDHHELLAITLAILDFTVKNCVVIDPPEIHLNSGETQEGGYIK